MIRFELQRIVQTAVNGLVSSGQLPAAEYDVAEIVDTKQPEHGDFACNFALTASKKSGKNPREVGELLRLALLAEAPSVFSEIEVAGPGFVNFRLSPLWVAGFVTEILQRGDALASIRDKDRLSHSPVPQKINLEFVSVNPNGPITIGSGRGAAYGSTLANVLEAAGHEVHREYYINDGVNSEQMRQFAKSVQGYISAAEINWLPQPLDVAHTALLRTLDAFVESVGPGQGGQPPPHFSSQLRGWISKQPFGLSPNEWQTTGLAKLQTWLRNNELADAISATIKSRYQASWLSGTYVPFTLVFETLGYKGDYVQEVAVRIVESAPSFEVILHSLGDNGLPWMQERAQDFMIARQNHDLSAFGVEFDTWFSEQSLHGVGKVEESIQHLIENGAADDQPYRTKLKLAKGGKIEEVEKETQGDGTQEEEEEGTSQGDGTTLWLRSTKFGDDMDRVLKRRDGRLTYIASDVAYHKDKFNRPENADRLITILGPDHHGYIGRLQAVLAAQLLEPNSSSSGTELTEIEAQLYASPEERDACKLSLEQAKKKLEVQIYQLVRFLKDGKPAPMRKRDGNIYALIDLIDEIGKKVKPNESLAEQRKVGKDVARFFYLMRSHDTTFDFDLDLAEKQSDENPVFYVQYAHARICSILAKAGEIAPTFKPELLTHPKELELIKKIADLPWEVQRCAVDYGVHRLTTYAIELARTFHHFYDACRVIQEEQPELTEARKSLCQATRQALQATFKVLGIEAPERMDRDS